MSGSKLWLPIGLALLTWFLTAIVALGASVSWSTLLIRSFGAALVVGGLTFVAQICFNKVLSESCNGSSLLNGEIHHLEAEMNKGAKVDLQVPSIDSFVPGQIEADLEQLLATDPARAAEIMRKMQLED